MSSPSLTDRLFWPAVVFATLALGGFGYFAATKMFRAAPVQVAYAPLDHVTHAAEPKAAPAPAAPVETPAAEVAAAQPATPAAPEAAAPETAEAAPAVPAKMEPDDPYMVPDHKPFIDQSTFAKKAPPKQAAGPKKALPKVAPGAVANAVPTLKPQPPTVLATPAPVAPKIPLSSDIKVPEIPAPQHPTYVMNDGRRILAVKVVDLGEFWGLKTVAGQIVSVRKEDVKEVAR